ncbi:PilN domain-containing protein [Magnetospira sp. QH-2]|uniref:PilN domain-containing protein n=1 Tax=Magnetospira sp. (strain QH-2) TaxID=1288970 RepID=UPI0005F9EF8C|nr:PilN domain-containing protein [Magnetospira sp. QH-2]
MQQAVPLVLLDREDEAPLRFDANGRPLFDTNDKAWATITIEGLRPVRRRVVYPLAAVGDLRAMVGHRIAELTPFAAEVALFDVQVVECHAESGKVTADVVAVDRRRVQPALDQARDMKIRVKALHLDGRVLRLAREWRPRIGILTPTAALVLVNLLLIGAAIALPLTQKQLRIERLESRLADLRLVAKETLALSTRLDERKAAAGYVTRFRRATANPARALDELSRVLPDHTWATGLTLKDGELSVTGQSGHAAALIAQVEDSSLFHQTRFTSPVTLARDGERERFSLMTTWAGKKR